MSKITAKRLMAFAAACVLLLSFAVHAAAEDYPFVKVTKNSVAVRSRASSVASVLITVPANQALLINGENGSFYSVAYDGYTGYVEKTYLNQNAPVTYTTLKNGSKGDAVKELQQALKDLGYYRSTVDGKYGAGTQNAVKTFQKMNGLSQTGTADLATQTLLFQGKPKNSAGLVIETVVQPEYPLLSRGSKGENVKTLQRRLKELGFYSSSIDGDYGTGTYNAVKAFQKKAGLAQTGIANQDTQLLLFASTAPGSQNNVPTPTPAPVATPTPVPSTGSGYPYNTYTLASVNLRKGASTGTARLATVPKNGTVQVLEEAGEFVKVSYNGKTGYLMKEYVYIPAQYLPGNTLEEDTQARQDYASLQSGSRGPAVKALQEALKELGFYSGTPDSTYGSGTLTAVKAFQKKNKLKQDGVASPEMQKLIFEGKPYNSKGKKVAVKAVPMIADFELRLNDTGDAVTELQKKLATLGYYTAGYTTVFNSATQKAVKAFQKDHSMTADGVVGSKTHRLLNLLSATPVPGAPATAVPQNTPLTENNVIVMQNGTRGQAVVRLQERLMELGYYSCEADGIYDGNEMTAVRAFQKRNGIKSDGIAGLETQQKLYSDYAVPAEKANVILPTPIPFVTPDVKVTLRSGSSGEYVRLLQERLSVLGYYNSAVDGEYGSGTLRAVVTFQQYHGLDADGIAGRKTQELLYSNNAKTYAQAKPTPTPKPQATQKPGNQNMSVNTTLLQKGDRGDNVLRLQQRLKDLGYLDSTDGVYGPQTASAVTAFQRCNGLTADGIAGSKTQNKLYSSSAISASGGTVNTPVVNPGTSSGSGFVVPKASEVRYANWYTEIRSRAKLMPDVVIYDPDTGLHYNLHMFSFGKHADAEPPTKQDVEIMNRIIGESSWGPKYVWVIFSDGRVYIASTHSNGHTVDHDSDNGLNGHICLHFPRIMSEAEATGPYAVSHQKEILWGWEVTQAMIK